VRSDVAALHPTARKAVEMDVRIIEDQMQGYQVRIELWYTRLWELHGFRLDPASRLIRHQGMEVALTKREFQSHGYSLVFRPTAGRPLS
jgi:DNA-binding response OmpR family regulator